MSSFQNVEQFVFRVLRKAILRPVAQWRSRLEVIEQLEGLKRLGRGVVVNGPVEFGNPAATELGDDVCINPGLRVRGEGGLRIGSHVHFGIDVEILTSNHNYNRPARLPYDEVRLAEDVEIGDCTWVGDRVVIVPGVKIGEGAVLAAGAVVVRDVPPLTVVGGAPAKALRERDQEAYRKLRESNTYLGWPREHHLINGRRAVLPR